MKRADRVSIVAGVAVTLLGVLLLLDQAGALNLRFDYAAPAVLATVGVVLVSTGLAPRKKSGAGPGRNPGCDLNAGDGPDVAP